MQPLLPATPAQDPPAQLLEPSLVPRDVKSLPRLRDMAATFPFADSNSNKAECRHTYTQRILTWLVAQTAIEKVLPSTEPPYRTHIKHKHSQPSPLLFLG